MVSRNRWVLCVAVLLVLPGTLASVAFGAVGILMLIFLGLDWFLARSTGATATAQRRPVVQQLMIATAIASGLGGAIALVAWAT